MAPELTGCKKPEPRASHIAASLTCSIAAATRVEKDGAATRQVGHISSNGAVIGWNSVRERILIRIVVFVLGHIWLLIRVTKKSLLSRCDYGDNQIKNP